MHQQERMEKPMKRKSVAKRHLKNFLIDKKMQLRWMFRVVVIVTFIVTTMGFFLYNTIADATDQMLAQKMGDVDELTDESTTAFLTRAEKDKKVTLYTLSIWLGSLVIFISMATITFTHKIAGPVYKMRKIFLSINGGNLCLWENKLRRGDELKEAFEDFDDMLRRLREDRREDLTILENVLSRLDTEEQVPIKEQLNEVVLKYRKSIDMKS